MPNTFTLISTTTVGAGGSANITFSSIPATYTDLCLKISVRHSGASAGNVFLVSFNGSSANFSARFLEGTGNAVSSASGTINRGGVENGSSATSNTFSNGEIYIPNYASSSNKSYSSDTTFENNSANAYALWLTAGLWADSSAITSITIQPDVGTNTYVQYSSASLYGIKKD